MTARLKAARPRAKRVWIVVGWAYSGAGFAFSSTGEQRWHWTYKSAKAELDDAIRRWTGTNWAIVRMAPMTAKLGKARLPSPKRSGG